MRIVLNSQPFTPLIAEVIRAPDSQLISVGSEVRVGYNFLDACISVCLSQVWDSSTGACLHTLGPGSDDGTVGHKKKISAMTVNQLQPCKRHAI